MNSPPLGVCQAAWLDEKSGTAKAGVAATLSAMTANAPLARRLEKALVILTLLVVSKVGLAGSRKLSFRTEFAGVLGADTLRPIAGGMPIGARSRPWHG